MFNEFAKLDLAGHSQVEEGVWLNAWLEYLRVVVIPVHVFVLELVGILLLVSLVLELAVFFSHEVDVCEVVSFCVLLGLLLLAKRKLRHY